MKLSKLPIFRNKLGFTMIELLVVIAVIGILAAAVLAAINPIEQINKGRDTRTRADITSLVQASERYFVLQQTYPWNDNSEDGTSWTGNGTAASRTRRGFNWDGGTTFGNGLGFVTVLEDVDEVKSGYASRIKAITSGFWVYKDTGVNATVYGCFVPKSNAFKKQAADICATGYDINVAGVCITTNGDIHDANMLCVP